MDLSGSVDGMLDWGSKGCYFETQCLCPLKGQDIFSLAALVKLQATFASTNSGNNNFGFIISATNLNFCIRKLRRIVTNFIYLRIRVCIIDGTVIHVCRGLVQLKKSILTKEDKSSNFRQYL